MATAPMHLPINVMVSNTKKHRVSFNITSNNFDSHSPKVVKLESELPNPGRSNHNTALSCRNSFNTFEPSNLLPQ